MLTETWLQPKDRFYLKGFDVVRTDRRDQRGGGVAILVRDYLRYKIIRDLDTCNGKIEVCAIELDLKDSKLLIASCYRPPRNDPITVREWTRFFSQFRSKILIGGDFNAHHALWGDSGECAFGKGIVDSIEPLDILVLNEGQATFHSGAYNTDSAIDIKFVDDRSTLAYNWSVGESSWGSDHFPIFIELNCCALPNIKYRPLKKLYTRKTNWEKFSNTLKKDVAQNFNFEANYTEPLTKYSSFVALIEKCLYEATPNPKTSNVMSQPVDRKARPPCPWWTRDCDELIRLRRAAFLKFKCSPSRANFLAFKKAEVAVKHGLCRIKKESFQQFCEGLTKYTNPNYLWKKIKCFKNRFNHKDNANEYNEEKQENVVAMIERLCPPWTRVSTPSFQYTGQDEFLDSPFTEMELDSAISNVKLRSSPGVDRIDYVIISSLPKEAKMVLLEIYNELLALNSFPEKWRKYSIFFIPKGDGLSFRPISLAPCLCKILEKMIYHRICWWMEHFEKFPASQFGFRKAKSCMDNLALLYMEIIKAFKTDAVVPAVFLDIRSAYDNVLADVLIDKLKRIGFPSNLLAFIFNLVSARSLSFKFGDIDETRWVYRGLPQGSVLNPILYAIYVMELESNISAGCKIIQYADDVVIYSNTPQIRLGINDIKSSLLNVADHLDQLGLSLAPEKTKFIIFDKSRKKNRQATHRFSFTQSMIQESRTVRFLGLELESALGWSTQIKKITEMCQNPLKIISCLRSTWWGADSILLLRLYTALVRSRIEYGAFFFHNLPTKQSIQLERIQFKALRAALGYRISTPTNVILAEAKLPPLAFRFKYLGLNFLTKALATNCNHRVFAALEEIAEIEDNPVVINREGNIPLIECYRDLNRIGHLLATSNKPFCFLHPYDSTFFQPPVSFEEGQIIKASDNADATFKSIFKDTLCNSECFYTDGSKTPGNAFVGMSSVRIHPDQETRGFRSVSFSSIFTAEAMAIAETLSWISRLDGSSFAIFSDSRSVLQAVSSPPNVARMSYLVMYLKNLLKILQDEGKTVKLFWIPAHVGIAGNELADITAKEAPMTGRDTQLGLPIADFTSMWKATLETQFHEWCLVSNREKGRYYFNNYYNRGRRPWFYDSKLTRRDIVKINRLRSNHTSLRSSLNRFNIVPSARCPCDEADETPNHVLWECRLYERERLEMLKGWQKGSGLLPCTVESLLCEMKPSSLHSIGKFLSKIDVLV